jgi:hypothetical protein
MPFNQGGPVTDYKNDVGEGWWPILDELDETLAQIDPGYQTVQVKEKFGLLRVYISGSQEAQEAIYQYEEYSGKVCENCGQPGKLRLGGWVRTLCDECEGNR